MHTKTLSSLLVAITFAFGTYVYNNPPNSNSTNTSICMDYSNSAMNQLEVGLVHNMVNGYKDNQLRDITIPDDAHSIWFDLETLKKFIYHIEYNTIQTDRSITSKDLGIRIYYSSYPNITNWSGYNDLNDFPNMSYAKRHTLVAVPTIKTERGQSDFNPLRQDTYANGLKDLPFYSNVNPTNLVPALPLRSASNPRTGSQNHGSLIPPADGSGEGF